MKNSSIFSPNTSSHTVRVPLSLRQAKLLTFCILGLVGLCSIALIIWSPPPSKQREESVLDTEIPRGEIRDLQTNKLKAYQQNKNYEQQSLDRKHREQLVLQWQQDELKQQNEQVLKDNAPLPRGFEASKKASQSSAASTEITQPQHALAQQNTLVFVPKTHDSTQLQPSPESTAVQEPINPLQQPMPYHSVEVSSSDDVFSQYSDDADAFISLTPQQPSLYPSTKFSAITIKQQTVTNNSLVPLKLLEPMIILGKKIDKGTTLMARVNILQQRVELYVASLELEGKITAVNLIAYDLDAQKGLQTNMSISAELSQEISQNNSAGLHISNSSSGALFTDLTKELVGGVSKLINKKNRAPRVTLPQGYKLYLVNQ